MAFLRIWRRPAELQLPPGLITASEDLRYSIQPRMMLPGNRIKHLRGGGQAFPAMLEGIAAAEETIHFEIYILRSDRVGRRFADALIERARAGVKVRLMYDAVGSIEIDSGYLDDLADAGVELVEYHPVAPWRRRFSINRRNHRKMVIVDSRVAYTGGLNIGDEYDSLEAGGGGWHDVHARLEGPAVGELERLFRRNWIREGGKAYPQMEAAAEESVVSAGTALALILANDELRRRSVIRAAYLHAMRQARHDISIMNAYFIPDRGVRRTLANAVKRGVNVRIIVPERSDLPSVRYASQRLFASLLKNGVRLYQWPERMMHAKTAVIDSVWAKIGSYNLDNRSLRYNLEVVVNVIDHTFAEGMQAEFERDVAGCQEMQLATWQKRPLWKKVCEWFFFQFRHWL